VKGEGIKINLVMISPEKYVKNHTLQEYTFGFKTKAETTPYCQHCLFRYLL